MASSPSKRARISAPFSLCGNESEQKKRSSIDVLPDECLFDIFRRLQGQERSNCACVSKHWLTLLSSIRRTEMANSHTIKGSDNKELDGCLTRSIDGKKATDIRLSTIAVGLLLEEDSGSFLFEEPTLVTVSQMLVCQLLLVGVHLSDLFLCGVCRLLGMKAFLR